MDKPGAKLVLAEPTWGDRQADRQAVPSLWGVNCAAEVMVGKNRRFRSTLFGVLLTVLGITMPAPVFAAGTAAPAISIPPVSGTQILTTAAGLLGIRYRWGGTTMSGLDCSAYLSLAWQVPRQTTDTLGSVAYPLSKDQLQPGDALNLTTSQDPHHRGHVCIFAGWVGTDHTWMWVYEETRPRSLFHAIPYDPRFTPMRRYNYQPGDVRSLVPPPMPLIPMNPADPRLPNSLWT